MTYSCVCGKLTNFILIPCFCDQKMEEETGSFFVSLSLLAYINYSKNSNSNVLCGSNILCNKGLEIKTALLVLWDVLLKHPLSLHGWSVSSFVKCGVSFSSCCLTIEFWFTFLCSTEVSHGWSFFITFKCSSISLLDFWILSRRTLPVGSCCYPQNNGTKGQNQNTKGVDKNSFFWRTTIRRRWLLSARKENYCEGMTNKGLSLIKNKNKEYLQSKKKFFCNSHQRCCNHSSKDKKAGVNM